MKEWKITLLGAIVMFVAGVCMFLWGYNLDNASAIISPLSGYMLISNQFLMTFLAGVLFIGLGGGLLICTLLIYQLEKKP